ncbi:PAAR domain-containing protein [Buttiauxella sp. 3AFRM03]|uniref:PAAR domain-containing protein n=1 Tax=Buttiauxella sp. 3AFRM03 TaxID=2479367 RepID=UPI000EF7EB89|nr:PAAR domain-containing protein [Buttiauxella sp. 3AFRM03]AYN28649.1 PAAR domain-containing protein [Buttiauxella sp. 3AFRM03]
MAKGYYLFRRDKTECGGVIAGGCSNHQHFGKDIACERDEVTCGKHPGKYMIAGGIRDRVHGNRIAGTLHSVSTCPCQARFIPSVFTDYYELDGVATGTHSDLSHLVDIPELPEPIQHAQSAKKEPEPKGVDAGFAVIPYGGTTEGWQRLLFSGQPPAGAKELFAVLNIAGNEYKAGSIMLLVDPDKQDSEQIAHMQAAKERIDTALAPLTHQEANFLHQHYATIANFTSIAEKGIGLAAEPVKKYFENIEKILNEIQETYKNTYLTRGALIGEQFHVRRSQLFKELDTVLKVGFLNKAMKLGEYTKIKHALGLSTSSITHQWNETGVRDIDGYATHIERAAKYTKAMQYAGYIGIGFSALHSMNEINAACSVGREDECSKKKYTEVGSFSGGVAGGLVGGAIGMGVCSLVLGAATMAAGGSGALACGIILGASGGYVGGELASPAGETIGEFIYGTVGK